MPRMVSLGDVRYGLDDHVGTEQLDLVIGIVHYDQFSFRRQPRERLLRTQTSRTVGLPAPVQFTCSLCPPTSTSFPGGDGSSCARSDTVKAATTATNSESSFHFSDRSSFWFAF